MTSDRSDSVGPLASWRFVERFLADGQPARIRLSGTTGPRVDYVITDAGSVLLDLHLGARRRAPRSSLPAISADEIRLDGERFARIRLIDDSLLRDFHDLVIAVADRVVTHGHTPARAFADTVDAWDALLRRSQPVGPEVRTGIFGELLTLSSVAAHHGWSTAVHSWKGPHREEHDFGLPTFDVEVKTTTSERRRHRINGLHQLTPTPDRPLWLVSLRLTRGGAHGHTLTSLVTAVRAAVAEHAPEAAAGLTTRLRAMGWSEHVHDDERWVLRDAPLVLAVDPDVPRLDAGLLDPLPADLRSRIDNLSYDVDLTGLPAAAEAPGGLSPFSHPSGLIP
jgi:hypothetical protein